jgi:ethanolamine permease
VDTSHSESSEYLAKRSLKQGSAGWLLLAGLGVGYVISGDYSGWNFGLGQGGFGGLLIAGVIIAGMYLAMVLGMAEMSSALPAAGGGYTSPAVPSGRGADSPQAQPF